MGVVPIALLLKLTHPKLCVLPVTDAILLRMKVPIKFVHLSLQFISLHWRLALISRGNVPVVKLESLFGIEMGFHLILQEDPRETWSDCLPWDFGSAVGEAVCQTPPQPRFEKKGERVSWMLVLPDVKSHRLCQVLILHFQLAVTSKPECTLVMRGAKFRGFCFINSLSRLACSHQNWGNHCAKLINMKPWWARWTKRFSFSENGWRFYQLFRDCQEHWKKLAKCA